jgi:5-methylcytosine-specific restriction endonuclease McrA
MNFQKIVDMAAMQAAANATQEECSCSRTEVRERVIRGGSKQYVHQCLDCGESVGNPVKQVGSARVFDEELKKTAREKATALRWEAKEAESALWWGNYERYMSSPEWKALRGIVLARDKHTCQGCLTEPAKEVHHRTYEHFMKEFAFELMSLCKECHDRMHEE